MINYLLALLLSWLIVHSILDRLFKKNRIEFIFDRKVLDQKLQKFTQLECVKNLSYSPYFLAFNEH